MKIIKEYHAPAANIPPEMVKILTGGNVLIAGTAGSGKSVLLNNLIYNAMALYTPPECGFIFIDPKIVELGKYKNLPHTITRVTAHAAALATLEKLLEIVRDRFAEMEKTGETFYTGKKIIVFIDEIADLMTGEHGKGFTTVFTRLLQISRAAAVSIVACTQSPSRKTIAAGIVCNIQTRIALRCLSPIESRQIINARGAENIQGYGKAILLNNAGYSQLDFDMIPESDIKRRVSYWEHYKPDILIKL